MKAEITALQNEVKELTKKVEILEKSGKDSGMTLTDHTLALESLESNKMPKPNGTIVTVDENGKIKPEKAAVVIASLIK